MGEFNALFGPDGSSLATGGCRYMVVSSTVSAPSVPQGQREFPGTFTLDLPLRDRDACVARNTCVSGRVSMNYDAWDPSGTDRRA